MKDILGHKSWNKEEILVILARTTTFTMCALPHYRFDPVKNICRDLQKRGFIKKSGRTQTAINFVITDLFREWRAEYEGGLTNLSAVAWHKQYKKEGRDLV